MTTAIECKLIRKGGTHVDIDGIDYHFAPLSDGAHVCNVENEEHVERFLSIREGYRLYCGEGKPDADPEGPEDQAAPDAPATSERSALAAQFEALYGKKPHHNTGVDKLREMIAAKQ